MNLGRKASVARAGMANTRMRRGCWQLGPPKVRVQEHVLGRSSVTMTHLSTSFLYLINPRSHVLNVPFVLGTSPSLPGTLVVACLIATAKALNALSARW